MIPQPWRDMRVPDIPKFGTYKLSHSNGREWQTSVDMTLGELVRLLSVMARTGEFFSASAVDLELLRRSVDAVIVQQTTARLTNQPPTAATQGHP